MLTEGLPAQRVQETVGKAGRAHRHVQGTKGSQADGSGQGLDAGSRGRPTEWGLKWSG